MNNRLHSSILINLRAHTALALLLAVVLAATAPAQFDAFSGMAGQQPDQQLVTAKPLLSMTSAKAGATYRAAVVVDILAGWHINSARPRQDFLIPAKLEFDTTAQLTPGKITYPSGEEISLINEMMSVYSGQRSDAL